MGKLIPGIICMCIILSISPGKASPKGLKGWVQNAWTKFWSLSCHFSSGVTRSKREADGPPNPGEDDPEKFFNFLYPSAHVRRQDLLFQEGSERRSSFSSGTFITWIDDTIVYWQEECRRRKMEKAEEQPTTTTPSMSPFFRLWYEGLEKMGKDTGRMFGNDTKEHFGKDIKGHFGNDTKENFGVDIKENFGNDTMTFYKNGTTRQGPGLGLPLALPSELTPFLPNIDFLTKQEDKFFNQFGGDIEYFIPLIGFGLPFDGEMTLLGFHGFKGLFPYK